MVARLSAQSDQELQLRSPRGARNDNNFAVAEVHSWHAKRPWRVQAPLGHTLSTVVWVLPVPSQRRTQRRQVAGECARRCMTRLLSKGVCSACTLFPLPCPRRQRESVTQARFGRPHSQETCWCAYKGGESLFSPPSPFFFALVSSFSSSRFWFSSLLLSTLLSTIFSLLPLPFSPFFPFLFFSCVFLSHFFSLPFSLLSPLFYLLSSSFPLSFFHSLFLSALLSSLLSCLLSSALLFFSPHLSPISCLLCPLFSPLFSLISFLSSFSTRFFPSSAQSLVLL